MQKAQKGESWGESYACTSINYQCQIFLVVEAGTKQALIMDRVSAKLQVLLHSSQES